MKTIILLLVLGPASVALASACTDTLVNVRSDAYIPAPRVTKVPVALFGRKQAANVRMVAVGGALSSGYRNGGLYREAQLTSFPKLFANQMGIPFNQPLFAPDSANGTGYKLIQSESPLVGYRYVTNKLGLGKSGWGDLQKFAGKIDNFTFPGLEREFGALKYSDPEAVRHIVRLPAATRDLENRSILEWLSDQIDGDFFLLEIGFDDVISAVKRGQSSAIATIFHDRYDSSAEIRLMEAFHKRKMKGVLFTVPHAKSLPYFNQVTPERLEASGVQVVVSLSASEHPVPFNPGRDLILPSVKVENSLSGRGEKLLVLTDGEVLSADPYDDEWKGVDPTLFNTYVIRRKAKLLQYPVADLNQLYQDILTGNFVTHDGVKVDPFWPGGNFFSSDGIFPTAFGQAVITNEVIRVVNLHYKAGIPLLQTAPYLKLN